MTKKLTKKRRAGKKSQPAPSASKTVRPSREGRSTGVKVKHKTLYATPSGLRHGRDGNVFVDEPDAIRDLLEPLDKGERRRIRKKLTEVGRSDLAVLGTNNDPELQPAAGFGR